jgi:hypothetical protein
MRQSPYAPLARVEQGTMSVADVIEKVRQRFGQRAAASMRITVH